MKHYLLLLLSLALASCGAIDVNDYAETAPALDLRTFLSGDLKAYGMLQDRSGRMTRRFTATMQGTWDGERGVLVEQFEFDDGELQERIWHLQHDGQGRYTGTAGDVVGTATGSTGGSVFNWNYQLNVPWREDSITVALDDWLYLVDERHLLNRTTLTKFGFKVGELTLVIEKL
jgi:hypothetical protein